MELKNLSVLVTGGAGFIGSHIVEYLLNNGVKYVRILDNLSTGFKNNIEPFLDKFNNVEFMWGDIRNLETCRKACKDMSVVCHQAALGSVPRSIDNPLDSHDVNVNGFINILLACKENDIKRIVYASSSSVYGTNDKPIKIEHENGDPLSPYAVTKYVDELYANIFTRVYGMECIGLRYFNVFGPRQNPDGVYAAVIPKFIKMIVNNQQPTINGDGTYSRDFTYIENVVNANILALMTSNSVCYGQAFNVGTNSTISVNELFEMIKKLVDNKLCEPVYGPVRKGDVPYSNASINKISELLGYQPKIYFEDGLKMTVSYFAK
ncbi:NAD-dependent epimerase/dehydratase [Tupanvirus soda lake]|uniref:NAD-dependent epimerase/dehydratase n=2 Tax=Tupanvirus TaxID=2094720 RepID=A0A6N1NMC5_9VIRU|nr:NAD-dependent epimerase/dehydratase [Tupanvirus soda lake]QKU35170.1 NAD-dependent epimerase/dehydratase [Tupanvirus soda lake]